MTGLVRQPCTVEVVLESPFLFRGLAGVALGIDAAQLRDGDDRPLIPGDHLRGLLRQALRDLVTLAPTALGALTRDDVETLLGRESLAIEDRGRLNIADLAAAPTTFSGKILPRVALEADTGSARSGHLQMIELVAPVGSTVAFAGRLALHAEASQIGDMVRALDRAIRLIPAMGAFKTAGFGRIVSASVAADGVAEPLVPAQRRSRTERHFRWSFGFDRPLMVASERVEENVFRSSATIPGGTLKGALARQLMLAGIDPTKPPWEPVLAALAIGHGQPQDAQGHRLERPLPLSLIAGEDADGIVVADALAFPGPILIGRRAPAFEVDWKAPERARARTDLGYAENGAAWIMRTRTAIAEATGAAAKAQLFSYQMVDPKGLKWVSRVDVGKLQDPELDLLLELMASGLGGIGKTDARMLDVDLRGEPRPRAQALPGSSDTCAVMLETPALMFDPDDVRDGATLRSALEAYWSEASARRLRLVDFFAAQSLAGGYVAKRFRLDMMKGYHPFVLMDPGSCFRLEGDVAAADTWLAEGLPLPAGLGHADWRNCPYLRQNGYGAVSLNPTGGIWAASAALGRAS